MNTNFRGETYRISDIPKLDNVDFENRISDIPKLDNVDFENKHEMILSNLIEKQRLNRIIYYSVSKGNFFFYFGKV